MTTLPHPANAIQHEARRRADLLAAVEREQLAARAERASGRRSSPARLAPAQAIAALRASWNHIQRRSGRAFPGLRQRQPATRPHPAMTAKSRTSAS